ncbi:hypothetical protein ACMU_11780 [Actibacterium mucosum KCTC 23349]|uniref:Yip1 domain-containing protein n=1 Tax=Actibacterium mucosum KCTC 23349 TaxID=1454373 RepID=A0A037ZGX3_9RHOB|nr:hypothetical protein [Actibacterium mucosum]KAJ55368.1 hypothetical protein ACMU_11780 [Actibacterium mucosum KCTC 23349]
MSIAANIVAAYRTPAPVMRRMLQAGQREDRALAILVMACVLIFVSSLPEAFRLAESDPTVPLAARLAAGLFAWLAIMPLAAYAIAALSHIVARTVGGKGNWYSARLALFWSLLAAAPLWMLATAVQAVTNGPFATAIAALALAGFVYIWMGSLWAAERPEVTA